MKSFIKYFLGIMDQKDKKAFKRYLLISFCGSAFSVLGIGAVIPLINLLVMPKKIESIPFFSAWPYEKVVILFTVMLILAYAIKNLISFFLLKMQSNFLFSLVSKIQGKLFKGYMALPYSEHLYRSTPDLIKVVNNETTLLANFLIGPFGIVLTEALSSAFVLIVLFLLNPIFTVCVAFFLLLGVFLFMRLIKLKIEHYSLSRSKSWSLMTENVLEGLSGIKEAKLYHCETTFINNFNKATNELRNAGAFQLTFQQAPRMLIEFIGLTVVMSVLCGFVLAGKSPQSMFVLLGVFGIAAAQLLPSLNRASQSLVQIKYGMPALKLIYKELLNISEKGTQLLKKKNISSKCTFNSEIELKDLSYRYQDGTVALCDINLKVYKNKRTALVGESGAGKTTLVDILLGLYQPSQGKISIDGVEIKTDEQLASVQKLYSYIPQSIVLYDKTIRENIAFGVKPEEIDEQRIKKCLRAARLESFIERLSEKEYTYIGEGGVRLSGGQRQRIGIARALYQKPEVLVMDEATSALDNQTEKEITSVLAELNNLTILTVAHRLSTIKHYDSIYVLQDGRVVSEGTYEELLENCSVFRKMVAAVSKDR